MNYLTLLLHYFSESRLSEILVHFGIDQSGSKTKSELINQLSKNESFKDNLLHDYLYKAELQNFCKSVQISSSSGTKKQIWERIKQFLKTIDSNAVKFSKSEQNSQEISITLDNGETIKMRTSSEMLYENALSVVQKLLDYWNYDKSEEKAIKALKRQHPALTLDDCKEGFDYALTAYKEAISIVGANLGTYFEMWEEKQERTKRKIKALEKKFLEKYTKLNERDLWIFGQIFFWYHLK